MRRYSRILRHPRALWPFLAALVGRLPVSMTPIGMVLLVQEVRGAYAIAGVVTAMFALGTAAGTPAWGRLVDRTDQPRVIGPLSVVSAVFIAATALSTVGGAPDAVLVVLAAGAGLTFPPISPAMRGAWRVILDDEQDRRAAYALEAVVIETIFVAGPLLLSAMLVLAAPAVPLLVTALLLGLGGVGYSLTHAARAWRPEPHEHGAGHRGRSPLTVPGVLAVLAVATLTAVGFGQMDVALAATARETLGDQARIGLLFMAIAGGSAVGGLLYGSRHWRGPERLRLPVVLTTFTVGVLAVGSLLVALGKPALIVLLPVLFVTGLSIAPGLIVEGNLIDHFAPKDRLNEAQAWLTTAFTSGGAAGNAIAGLVIDAHGPGASFFWAASALGVAAVAAMVCQRLWSRPGARASVPVGDTAPSFGTAA